MCSASMNSAPSRFASTTNWRPTLDPISHETSRRASLGGSKTLFIVPSPELDLSHQEAPQMLLVDGLSCDPEGLGHLRPGPARAHRPLDLGILEPISDRAQRGRSREAVSRSADWRRGRGHVSNSSCLEAACQPQLLKPPAPGPLASMRRGSDGNVDGRLPTGSPTPPRPPPPTPQ